MSKTDPRIEGVVCGLLLIAVGYGGMWVASLMEHDLRAVAKIGVPSLMATAFGYLFIGAVALDTHLERRKSKGPPHA